MRWGKDEWGHPKYAFLEKTLISDYSTPDQFYLKRWRLIECPWFGMFVHTIYRPDNDRNMHNHPWSFVSLVLTGWYVEEVGSMNHNGIWKRKKWARTKRRFHFFPHGFYHNIQQLSPTSKTRTLVFVGRKQSDWGFMTDQGFVDHETYFERGQHLWTP